jgi:glycosyltransferase involved in cell wall biosynthesis
VRHDADRFGARAVTILPNGIPDPGESPPPPPVAPCRLLFLALCSEEKGLFAAANATLRANVLAGATATEPAFVLTAAGPFDQEATAARFAALAREHPAAIRHAGTVDESAKHALFAASHALCFPTHYSAEAQPLVVLESFAHGRPVIATAWRGLPELVSPDVGLLVPVGDESALANALLQFRRQAPSPAVCRARFRDRYTVERHLDALVAALRQLA